MKATLGFILGFILLSGVCSGGGWREDFEGYRDDGELRKVWGEKKFSGAFEPQLSLDFGREGKKSLRLSYNGNAGVRGFNLPGNTGDTIIIKAILCGEKDSAELRMMAGPDGMTWNTAQAQVLFGVGRRISLVDQGKVLEGEAKTPVIRAGKWYELKVVVRPNLIKGGTYDVFINNFPAGAGLRFSSFVTEATTAVRFGYAGKDKSGRFFIDDVSVSAGPSSTAGMGLDQLIAVTLPVRPVLGWRFYDHLFKMDLTFRGNLTAAVNVKFELFQNRLNFPAEAEKTATKSISITPPTDGKYLAKFEGVPFGGYLFRVTAVGKDGKTAVLQEEPVAMIHREPKQASPDEWVWGMDTHADRNDRRWDIDIPSLKEMGANWARIEFLWRDITDEKGTPNFSHHDLVVNEAAKRGIRLFGCLTTTARHAEVIPGGGWGSPPKLDAFEAWCRQVMGHFKGRIFNYEILNEPDGYAFWWFGKGMGRAEWQGEMIKIAAKVAKEISPDIHVMGPSLTVIGVPYFRRLVEAGAFDGIDDISGHLGAARHPRSYFKQLQRILAERYPGRRFTWWSTESGNWDRAFLANFAEPDPVRMFHYVDRDKGTEAGNYEHNNGLIKAWGTPKEAYIKYQNMVRCFANSRYIGRALVAKGVEGYLFERKGIFTVGLWSENSEMKIIDLPELQDKGVSVTDTVGNPVPERPLPVRDILDPMILVGVPRTSDIVLDASINCRNDYTMAGPDKAVKLSFTFQNLSDHRQKYELDLQPPKGWSISRTKIIQEVDVGKTAEAEARADIPADSDSEDVWIEGTLKEDGKTVKKRFGPIWVVNKLRLMHFLVDDFEGPNKWVFPEQIDVHTAGDDWGVRRKGKNLNESIEVNRISQVTMPVFSGRRAGRFDFGWKRPKEGWNWMACTFAPARPIELPGEPVELRMKVYMEDINTFYPITILARFVDSTGQVFQIEGGGEIYWTGWREFRMTLPSRLGDGYIHSTWGGAKDGKIHYPVKFAGFVFNLPPKWAITYMPENCPRVKEYLVLDDIEIVSYR